MHELFVPRGFTIYLAGSGEEALDIARSRDIHLALLDIHLPKLSGIETLGMLRQSRVILPVILMSADHDENLLRRALAAHAFSVLSKPVSGNEVMYVVTRALEKYY
ncbi:MAG: response regulator [Planctomycetota bacterium]|nr:response regulator [Planctomycetota bacterium]